MLSLVSLLLVFGGNPFYEDAKPIEASSIGHDYVLIGELGVPLGEVIDIVGQIHEHQPEHHKDSKYLEVYVEQIGDEKLEVERTITLWDPDKDDLVGKSFRMLVIEDAHYELLHIPNLSSEDENPGRQSIATGLKILALLNPVEFTLGPSLFRPGDTIAITSVEATSPNFKVPDTVIVRGRYALESRQSAKLSLFVTQTKTRDSVEVQPGQKKAISQGEGEFELRLMIPQDGYLHVSFYPAESGQAFGGVYFGTAEQMKRIRDWDLSYYFKD